MDKQDIITKLLNQAIRSNHKDVVGLLIDTGAKPNGYTLNRATKTNNPEIIKLIKDSNKRYNNGFIKYITRRLFNTI